MLLALALKDSNAEDRNDLQEILSGNRPQLSPEEQIDRLRAILENCHAFEKAETLIERSRERCQQIIDDLEDERLQTLLQFFLETVLAEETGPTPQEHLDPDSPEAIRPPTPAPTFVPLSIGQ